MAYLLCLRLWDALIIGTGAFIAARAGAGILTEKPKATQAVHLVGESAGEGSEPQEE